MITHNMIGADESLAREVLVIARDIAPCIASLSSDSEAGKDAIAILSRVYREITSRGSRLIRSQRLGPASVEYASVSSAFEGDPTRALRSLCVKANTSGHSTGSFPMERAFTRVWPERY